MTRALIAVVNFYRKHLSSPDKARCRFIPTCSGYALQALEKYGAVKGGFLILKRIFRCHPFCKGGYDPVP
ncbi:MAG: membrane protein insertion efficiency factor YidD [Oscillospiraceae bacterium]|nr:membrane protein insertion efficiency factor YidD [Oscillospiraceae bacterium]